MNRPSLLTKVGIRVVAILLTLGISSGASFAVEPPVWTYVSGAYNAPYAGYQSAPILGYGNVSVNTTLLNLLSASEMADELPGIQLNQYGGPLYGAQPNGPLWPGAAPPNYATDGKASIPRLLSILTPSAPLKMIMGDFEVPLTRDQIQDELTEIRSLVNGNSYASGCWLGNYQYAGTNLNPNDPDINHRSARYWVDFAGALTNGGTLDMNNQFYRNQMVGGVRVLNVSSPVCYFRAFGTKLHRGNTGIDLPALPNDRAAMFYQALTCASDAGLYRAPGDLVIPYVGDWVPPTGWPQFNDAPKIQMADRRALLSHLRLRRMNGYIHFATQQTANDLGVTLTDLAEYSYQGWHYGFEDDQTTSKVDDMGNPWLDSVLAGTNSNDMIAYGNWSKERDGVMISACKKNNGTEVILVVTNLSNQSVTLGIDTPSQGQRDWRWYFGFGNDSSGNPLTPAALIGKTLTVPAGDTYYRLVTEDSGSVL